MITEEQIDKILKYLVHDREWKVLFSNKIRLRIRHFRRIECCTLTKGECIISQCAYSKGDRYKYSNFGGKTKIIIYFSPFYNRSHIILESNCSKKDQFCRRTGMRIALSRLSEADFSFIDKIMSETSLQTFEEKFPKVGALFKEL